MSYVNQDPDIIVPFKGKHVVAQTRRAWMEEMSAACWCGSTPGSCNDCHDCDTTAIIAAQASGAKVNISSGEDADLFRPA